jgi:hypothetical protein
MTYLRITQDFIDLTEFSQITELLVELDGRGAPRREIGLNSDGAIVHMFPNDKFRYGKHGILDMAWFDLNLIEVGDLSAEVFDSHWSRK